MRNMFLIMVVSLLMVYTTGCKVPGSVIDGAGVAATKLKQANEVCQPLLDEAITEVDKRIAAEEDEKKKEKLEKIKKAFETVKKNLPKIVRNLEQLKRTLEAFNGLISKDKKDEAPTPEEVPKKEDAPAVIQ
jgi:exonuclease VII small subunit